MRLVSELRRRNVLRMAVLYAVAAWLIVQVAGVLIDLAKLPDWIGTTTLWLLAVGFPIALIFSWFYEITPEGVILEKDVDPEVSITHVTGRRLDFIVISMLCAAVILFAYDKWWIGPPPELSIAVLPFENMSADPEQEYFSDGISEELLNALAKLPDLRVAARTSSFQFKGQHGDIAKIAAALNVAHILEGSVRKSGNKIRITAQLIKADDGFHLWSETYDREADDIFAVQDEIALAITSALEVKVLGRESKQLAKNPTDNFGAYDYYLLGQYQREKRNPKALEKSIELFKQALELDEQFALGYSALALSYLYQRYYSNLSPEEVEELTNPLIRKSLELDPDLAHAHGTRASVRLMLRDFAAADAGYRRALELQPNHAGSWSSLGFSMVLQSRLKEAEAAYKKSEVLDPLNASLKFNMGALMMLTGRYEEGLQAFEKVVEIAPERTGTADVIAQWSRIYGRYEEAARWVVRSLDNESDLARAPASLVEIYANLGMWDKSWEAISRAHEMSHDDIRLFEGIADFYFLTGDHAGLISIVTKEYEELDQSTSSRYSPTNKSRYFWHGVAALLEGNNVQAVNDLTNAAGGQDGIAAATYDEITKLKYLAYAYQKQGKKDSANALLTKCLSLAKNALDQGWDTPTIHYRTAQIYALLGNSNSAIEELQRAVDKGWRIAGSLEQDPLWTRLQKDVRFQTIATQVNDDLEIQRNLVTLLLADLLIDQ